MKVVDPGDWFRVTDAGDGVTQIDEPGVRELLAASIWHVRGRDRDLVIDAGLGITSLRAALPWLFEHDPVLVLSHAHLDHMGGAHEFADCRVHAAELDAVRAPGPASLRGGRLLEILGIDPDDEEVPEILVGAVPYASYDADAYSLTGVPAATAVTEGDLIDLGDRQFAVLHLPGHTPGSISLCDHQAGQLFTGDVLYEGGLIDSCSGSDPVRYAATMRRLLELPMTRVFPGHGPVLGRRRARAVAGDYLSASKAIAND
jgi:glyoxylase-like metal-dependent hydrolase (beta-lactamase superfamily II)